MKALPYVGAAAIGFFGWLIGYTTAENDYRPHLQRADEMLRCYEKQSTQPITVDYYLRREGMREALE